MTQPTVSVFIPSYNYRRFIGEAIESILQQSYDDWELVIVDDASSDGSQTLIAEYAERHPDRIRAFYLPQNVGQSQCSRIGLSHCRGRYVSIIASDDIATPHRLAEGVALLEQNSGIAAVFSHAELVDADGNRSPANDNSAFNEKVDSIRWRMLYGNFLCGTSGMLRADVLKDLGGWNPNLSAVEDYDLWMRMLTEHQIVRSESVWVKYRIHGSNLSVNTMDTVRFGALYETVTVALAAIERWPLTHLFEFRFPKDSPAHREELATAKIKLARHCLWLDQHHFQRPLIATGKAYTLALEAVQLAPHLDDAQTVLREVYAFLGDKPRAEGGRSILLKDLQIRQSEPQLNLAVRQLHDGMRRSVLQPAQRQAYLQQGHAPFSLRPIILALQGEDVAAIEATLESLSRQLRQASRPLLLSPQRPALADLDWRSADSENWHQVVNQALTELGEDWCYLLHAGDRLAEYAVAVLAEASEPDSAPLCFYSDEDNGGIGTHDAPIFKPDFNLDLLRSYAYTGASLAFQREACLAAGGLLPQAGPAAGQDLIFRIVEQFGLHRIGHLHHAMLSTRQSFTDWLAVPELAAIYPAVVGAHLRRLGIEHRIAPGAVAGINRVHYQHAARPAVSIVIPTRDQLPLLNGLIDSLLARTSYQNYELLIVDNDSRDPAACAYLDGIEKLGNPQLRVLRYPHPFNYSAINNFAAAQARGGYLILLNNDTAIIQDDWIEALLNHAQRPEVGIVGAKLFYPDGRLQHGGVVLGLRGPADHPYAGEPGDTPGYMHRLLVDQNYTAVTAACLMIRKSVYQEVGGLDEVDFKVSYNDVDLCLKVRQAGYLTVWTPYCQLMHEGSVSQTKVDTSAQEAKLKRFQGEQQAMYRKWLPLLARDPAYNRNLSINDGGFDLDPMRNRAWQPFARSPLARAFVVAADEFGCGHYRVIQPFNAMNSEGLLEGIVAEAHWTPVALERFEADTLVLQRQVTDQQLEIMQGYRDFIRAFKVYELDDYLPNVPVKSAFRKTMPKDILKSLRRAISLTDRFVVSTAPLAEQFAGFHPEIRVVPNRLPVNWWQSLQGERRTGRRPRVGWGGGTSHTGDLELIADVVRELAAEVEWVFFGMCPDKLRPYVHEFHPGVPIEQYPAKLASLNLDLALAPVEDNVFNACKSNLRLLEYGACGFPVIASDIVCYRGELPVTLVKNRYKDWVDAIRMHLADLDAAAKQGDALRTAVHKDWMLSGDNLRSWRDAWLPG